MTLQPGQSTTVQVTFKPTTAGGKAATLAVSHSGASSPLNIPLSGTGTSSAVVGFGKSTLSGTTGGSPTTLQFGPDGRLYVGYFRTGPSGPTPSRATAPTATP